MTPSPTTDRQAAIPQRDPNPTTCPHVVAPMKPDPRLSRRAAPMSPSPTTDLGAVVPVWSPDRAVLRVGIPVWRDLNRGEVR